MSINTKMQWKTICNSDDQCLGDRTYGMEVPGGILVRHETWDDNYGQSESMVFISGLRLQLTDSPEIYEIVA